MKFGNEGSYCVLAPCWSFLPCFIIGGALHFVDGLFRFFVFVFVFGQLKSRHTWEEGIITKEFYPSDWSMAMSVRYFLNY